MRVSVYSIEETLFEGEAEKVIAKTPMGEITVLDDHLPIVSSLVGPVLKIFGRDESTTQTIDISSGFLEVRPESEVVILKDS